MNKKYDVLQDFKGSPDGHTVIQFTKGSEIDHADMGDDLAGVAVSEKWVKLSNAAEKEAKEKAKAEAEAKAKAEAEVAALQKRLETAPAEEKGSVQAAIDAAKKKLAGLFK